MILLTIELPCTSCIPLPEDQPNYCRKCGGSGKMRSQITKHELTRLGDIPTVLGASIQVKPRVAKRKAVAKCK